MMAVMSPDKAVRDSGLLFANSIQITEITSGIVENAGFQKITSIYIVKLWTFENISIITLLILELIARTRISYILRPYIPFP